MEREIKNSFRFEDLHELAVMNDDFKANHSYFVLRGREYRLVGTVMDGVNPLVIAQPLSSAKNSYVVLDCRSYINDVVYLIW